MAAAKSADPSSTGGQRPSFALSAFRRWRPGPQRRSASLLLSPCTRTSLRSPPPGLQDPGGDTLPSPARFATRSTWCLLQIAPAPPGSCTPDLHLHTCRRLGFRPTWHFAARTSAPGRRGRCSWRQLLDKRSRWGWRSSLICRCCSRLERSHTTALRVQQQDKNGLRSGFVSDEI